MKIEAGKSYLTRNGLQVGPMRAAVAGKGAPESEWKFEADLPGDGVNHWRADGTYGLDRVADPSDLIVEWSPAEDNRCRFVNGEEKTDAAAEALAVLDHAATAEARAETATLRHGAYYKTAHGQIVGPMVKCLGAHDVDGKAPAWFEADGYQWSPNGRSCAHGGRLDIRPALDELTPSPAPVAGSASVAIDLEPDFAEVGYEAFAAVLRDALGQVANGKGKERHARGLELSSQPTPAIIRVHGLGFATGQAAKKAGEAVGMVSRGQGGSAERELLGAINFLVFGILAIREAQA